MLTNITGSIVQGRYDVVCPPKTAWDLHKALPDSKLYMIADAGHSAKVSLCGLFRDVSVTDIRCIGAWHTAEADRGLRRVSEPIVDASCSFCSRGVSPAHRRAQVEFINQSELALYMKFVMLNSLPLPDKSGYAIAGSL